MDYFTTNSSSDFNVRLPYKLRLDSRWKVGVNEIWLSKHWFNVTNAWIQISVDGLGFEQYNLTDGYYNDNSALVSELNRLTTNVSLDCASFRLERLSQKLKIEPKSNVMLKLSENICSLIGMSYDHIIKSEWNGDKSMDVNADFRIVAVCADFVSEQLFSDNVSNVIKMIDTSYQYYGEIVHDNNLSNYVKLRKDTLDTIHVQIKTESGRVLKCESGSCTIQLKFTCSP